MEGPMHVATEVHVVVPAGIDDPRRSSGGNVYDRRLCRELPSLGWDVHEHQVAGPWPSPGEQHLAALAAELDTVGDGAIVLVDGLVGCSAPESLARHSARLRLVALLHMPLGQWDPDRRLDEQTALWATDAVVTTSTWSRRWLVGHYDLAPSRVRVALPGVDHARPSASTPTGERLLCVGPVTPLKGHDLVVAALTGLSGLDWSCTFVGASDIEPAFTRLLRTWVTDAGIDERVRFTGALSEGELDAAYRAADVLVVASRLESYGMAVTEALAHGVPVIAARVGGVPEAVGVAADGTSPGLLVEPGDAAALGTALRRWLTDADLRHTLRAGATSRSASLPGWRDTAQRVSRVLSELGSTVP